MYEVSGGGESGSEDYRYTGKHEDPSGLYYFGARCYDPATGRFTTRDTVFGDLTDPQSQNRYVYCMNNPHKYVDPTGAFAAIAFSMFTGGLIGSTASMISYAAVSHVTGHEITAEGVISAGYSGFITGAVGVIAGPLGGSIAQAAGFASSGTMATGISLGVQALGDVAAYGLECKINSESFDETEATMRGVTSIGLNYGLGRVLPDTIGMDTIEQAKYFTPSTSDAYYGALFDASIPNTYNSAIISGGTIIGVGASQLIDPWLDTSSYMIDDAAERRRYGV